MASRQPSGRTSGVSKHDEVHSDVERAASDSSDSFSGIVVACAMESQSDTDYQRLRIILKDRLQRYGLTYLVEQKSTKDTFSLFEAVFSTDHANLRARRKLRLLKQIMQDLGKSGMADKVKHKLNSKQFLSAHSARTSVSGMFVHALLYCHRSCRLTCFWL